jgi:adenosylcobinamide-phosphate synthase
VALALDLTAGDPPNRYHPVAWMGSTIARARRLAPQHGRWAPCVAGAVLVVGGVVVWGAVGWLLERGFATLPWPLRWLAEVGVLKTTFALRGLVQASHQVQTALDAGNLLHARHLVSWHLVSRDTSQLTASQVAAATVESVAENTSDGIVAPWLFYVLGGLPAAFAYRFINTADAMLGYRDPQREWLGKVPARLDDLVNLVPARLTALCMLLAALFPGTNAHTAWQIWRRDARRPASPNAGHPMSVMAGALQVELTKAGVYQLGAGQAPPVARDIARAVSLVYRTVALVLVALALGLWVQAACCS